MALLFKRILQENGLTYTIEDGRIIVRKAAEHELEEVVKEPSADDDSVSRYVDGGPLTKPIKLDGPAPAYPEAAKKDGVTGVVVLDAVIGTDGRIARLEIVRSNDERLTEAATEAVADWTFEPATLHGEPVAVYYTLTVRFALE